MVTKRNYFKKYSDEQIKNFIETSHSASDTVIKMGYDPSQRFLVKRFSIDYNISIDHFSRVNQRTYGLNENFFSDLTSTSVYWLGFIMADGNVMDNKHIHSLKVQLAEKDIDHLEKLKKDLIYSGPITRRDPHVMTAKGRSYQATASHTLKITSKKLTGDLITLDCVPNKTQFGTQISDKIPKELVRHFIRGYFDGDGSIVLDKTRGKRKESLPQISIFILGSEKILNQIVDYVHSQLGVTRPSLSKRQGVFCIKWAGNLQCLKIFEWLYEDADRFLDRKYEKYIQHRCNYDNSKSNKRKKYIDAARESKNWKHFFELLGRNSSKCGLKHRQRMTKILNEEKFDFSHSHLRPED